jgi:hypothetical protein
LFYVFSDEDDYEFFQISGFDMIMKISVFS